MRIRRQRVLQTAVAVSGSVALYGYGGGDSGPDKTPFNQTDVDRAAAQAKANKAEAAADKAEAAADKAMDAATAAKTAETDAAKHAMMATLDMAIARTASDKANTEGSQLANRIHGFANPLSVLAFRKEPILFMFGRLSKDNTAGMPTFCELSQTESKKAAREAADKARAAASGHRAAIAAEASVKDPEKHAMAASASATAAMMSYDTAKALTADRNASGGSSADAIRYATMAKQEAGEARETVAEAMKQVEIAEDATTGDADEKAGMAPCEQMQGCQTGQAPARHRAAPRGGSRRARSPASSGPRPSRSATGSTATTRAVPTLPRGRRRRAARGRSRRSSARPSPRGSGRGRRPRRTASTGGVQGHCEKDPRRVRRLPGPRLGLESRQVPEVLLGRSPAPASQGGRAEATGIQENFPQIVIEAVPEGTDPRRIEAWKQDESHVGQIGTTTRVWAAKGSRPVVVRDRRFGNICHFAAVRPATGKAVAHVCDRANTVEMNRHLRDIAAAATPDAHVVPVLDGAGWHRSKDLDVPDQMTLVFLPPYSPEPNPMEQVFAWLKSNFLSNRYFHTIEDIRNAVEEAWNMFASDRELIASITTRSWATASGGPLIVPQTTGQ